MAKATKKNPTGLTSKASVISKVYNDEVIEAVKSFPFKAKRSYGTCAISGKQISKGDGCLMSILSNGERVVTLQSTTVAKGRKANKVGTTKTKSKPVAKATAKKVVKKPTAKKEATYSEAIVKAVFALATAKTDAAKYKVLMSLNIEEVSQVLALTK